MKLSELENKIKQRNPEIENIIKSDTGYQIGKQVELARGLKNLTQIELANLVGTKQSSISRIESGSSLPSISFLMKIAQAFNTYLIPPKFAFMENVRKEKIDYKAGYTANDMVVTPYMSPSQAHDLRQQFIME